jgi:hypothetical protein
VRATEREDEIMRYVLGVSTLVLLAAIGIAITSMAQGATGGGPNVVGIAPTAEVIPPGLLRREWAIEMTMERAHAYGEHAPELIEDSLTTYHVARARVALGDKVETPPALPDDAPVWFVRARGSFVDPHPMRAIDKRTGEVVPRQPKVGWMYSMIDAQTGRTLQSGFRGVPAP